MANAGWSERDGGERPLYICDHYVEPDYLLGNIQSDHMLELVSSEKQRQFGEDKRSSLPRYCHKCEVRFACHGGCPKNRFIRTPDGELGLNYLCTGYNAFFNHVDRPLKIMAGLLRQRRAPAEIMELMAVEVKKQLQQAFARTGRNDPVHATVARSLSCVMVEMKTVQYESPN